MDKKLKQLVQEHFKKNYRGVYSSKDFNKLSKLYQKQLQITSEYKFIKQVTDSYDLPKSSNILDMASGFGSLLLAFKKLGYTSLSGVDADQECVEIARLRGIETIHAYGEKLPFPKETFDLVTSASTIEHVQDVNKTLNEVYRVIKKGGHFLLDAPNYDSGWEGHYKINLRMPLLPHGLRKIFYKLRGRDPAFYNSLQYVTLRQARKKLQKQYKEVHDLQQERFMKEVASKKTTIHTIIALLFKMGLKKPITWLYDIHIGRMIFLCTK